MEVSSEEGEIQIPMNSSSRRHGGEHGVMIQHEQKKLISPSNGYKKVVRYRECLKNHAAGMGGNATDGCGEFMPSGEEGTIEALNCSACHCHRNFHRKEVEGFDRRRIIRTHKNLLPLETLSYPTATANILPHQMIMPYNIGHLSDEQEDPAAAAAALMLPPRPSHLVKKRFRTKFTQEQKDKMLNFAHRLGWKIQKQEESLVQHFCQEIGVKRRVLKVWMHNNKHNLAKKNPPATSAL